MGVGADGAGALSLPGRRSHLASFLTGRAACPPAPEVLRAADVAAYVYSAAEPADPLTQQLKPDFLRATMRHIAVRAAMSELLRAWQERGIEALVFKGFYLAEFVYDSPARRHYNDVDVLIRPDRAVEAADIALALGWHEHWHIARPATMFARHSQSRSANYRGHEIMNLDHHQLLVRLDVHRRIAHSELGWNRRQERITQQAWRASEVVTWEGTDIRILRPLDSVLLGLVLNRGWGRDAWQLKASDYLDFVSLVQRFGVDEEGLWSRARELGCARTLSVFLRRCDPWQQRLELETPSFVQRMCWGFEIGPERGHPALELGLVHALDVPVRTLDVLRELPSVVRALVRGSRLKSVHGGPTGGSTETARTPLSYRKWQRIQRAVRRILKLCGRDPDSERLLVVLALFYALRSREFSVRLCTDPDHQVDEPATTAWLEVDGRHVPMTGAFHSHAALNS